MRVKTSFDFAKRWRYILLKPTMAKRRKQKLIISGAAVFLLVGIAAASPWFYSMQLDKQLNVLAQEIERYKDIEGLLERETELETMVEAKQQDLAAIKAAEHYPRAALEHISRFLPKSSIITQFELTNDNTLNLSVTVHGSIDLARLWVSLRDAGFEVIDIDSVTLDDDDKSISLELKIPE